VLIGALLTTREGQASTLHRRHSSATLGDHIQDLAGTRGDAHGSRPP